MWLIPFKGISYDGTGTIIENKTDKIQFITAKHVVLKGITNLEVSVRIACNNTNYTSIASYEEEEVFIHPSLDFALVKAKLTNSNISKLDFFSKINNNPLNSKKEVCMYHYPWGVNDQRLNYGFINSLKYQYKHTIVSLPGSSGAPIFLNDEIIGIHVEAGEEFPKTKVGFDSEVLDLYKNNVLVKMSEVTFDSLTKLKR